MTSLLLALALAASPGFTHATIDAHRLDAEAARVAKEQGAAGRQVLVVFGAPWCKACHALERKLSQVASEPWTSKWAIVEVNVDDLPDGPILGIDFDEIPYLMRLDASGRPAAVLRGGEVLGHGPGQGLRALERFLRA